MFELPPSTNKLYQKRRGGGQALTKVALSFKRRAGIVITRNLAVVSRLPIDEDRIYQVNITLYFEKLENPGWFEFWEEDKFYTKDILFPKKHKLAGEIRFNRGEPKARKGQRKAESRYKKIDYDNRIKFLQDCVANLVGIPDDSQIFRGEQEKREDPTNPRAEVTIRLLDSCQYFSERRASG